MKFPESQQKKKGNSMGEQLVSVEKMVKKINEMEDQGQIVRPVAKALRREMGAEHEERPEEQFKLERENTSTAMLLEPGPKATKKDLLGCIEVANMLIVELKTEVNDVRRAAEHYHGFQGAVRYTAGQLYVLQATMFNNDMDKARKAVGKYFNLNALITDNLSNDPTFVVEYCLDRITQFWRDVNKASALFNFVLNAMQDADRITSTHIEMLRIAQELLVKAINRKGRVS